MARKRFSPEQIITMLQEAGVLLNQSNRVAEVCQKMDISEQTCYRWRKAKPILSSVNFDFFIRDVLLPRFLPQNSHYGWHSFQG